jgi:hypothetical protein
MQLGIQLLEEDRVQQPVTADCRTQLLSTLPMVSNRQQPVGTCCTCSHAACPGLRRHVSHPTCLGTLSSHLLLLLLWVLPNRLCWLG